MNEGERPDVRELARRLGKNVQLLRELLAGPKHKAELADALDVSKSTVYYRFEQLEEYHLVTREADGYQVTTVGRYLAETYLEALEAMENLCGTRELLRELPAEAVPPRSAFADATTVLPDGHPEQLWTEFCEWVLAADEVRAMLPRASCALFDRVHEKLQDEELTLEVTLSPEVTEYLASNRPEKYPSVVGSESVVARETTDLPGYGLTLVDEPRREFGLLVYTENGYLAGFVRFDSRTGWRWADELFSEYTDEQNPDATPAQGTAD